MALMLDAWDRGDNAALRRFFMEDARKIAAAGCGFLRAARQYGAHRDGIAGRAFSDSRPAHWRGGGRARRAAMAGQGRHPWHQLDDDWTGLSWCVGPAWNGLGDSDEADRKQVHDIILDELCLGVFTDERATPMCGSSRNCRRRLRCGRAGLHRNPAADHAGRLAAPDPRSTRLLAAAAVEVAVGESQCPNGEAARSARLPLALFLEHAHVAH